MGKGNAKRRKKPTSFKKDKNINRMAEKRGLGCRAE